MTAYNGIEAMKIFFVVISEEIELRYFEIKMKKYKHKELNNQISLDSNVSNIFVLDQNYNLKIKASL